MVTTNDPPPSSRRALGRVLLADDEPEPLRAAARILRHSGFIVDAVDDGKSATEAILKNNYDAIITDISMPNMSGIELLQFMRKQDEDVPVILVTGAPAVETAVEALEHGAYKYLVKPVSPDRLESAVQKAVQMRQMAAIRRQAVELLGTQAPPTPQLQKNFRRAMNTLWIAFQPIVQADGVLYGHEALLRSAEPSLPHPGAVLDAAERLKKLHDLGRKVRACAARSVDNEENSGTLFVNLHPRDLDDVDLVNEDSPLAKIATNVVLEITERSSVDEIKDLGKKIAKLRELGFRIAVDDLGAGYAGLTSFALLEPEIVKIDMTLVRDVDKLPVKARLIASITSLCREMGIKVVGEGVETVEERDKLIELGCDLLQGYWIAKPDRPFPSFNW